MINYMYIWSLRPARHISAGARTGGQGGTGTNFSGAPRLWRARGPGKSPWS